MFSCTGRYISVNNDFLSLLFLFFFPVCISQVVLCHSYQSISLPFYFGSSMLCLVICILCNCLYRCGRIDGSTFEELYCPKTIINLRMEPDIQELALSHHVNYLHFPIANRLEKYHTELKEVRIWLTDIMTAFLDEKFQFPVVIHCRSGRDRTGIVVGCLLICLGVPQEYIIQEFLLTPEAPKELFSHALYNFLQEKPRTGITGYFRNKINITQLSQILTQERRESLNNNDCKMKRKKKKKICLVKTKTKKPSSSKSKSPDPAPSAANQSHSSATTASMIT